MRVKVFCKECNKELKAFNKQRNKYYPIKTKTGLCRRCSAKKLYKKRGAFTHNRGKLWSNSEIYNLKKLYPDNDNKYLSTILKRPISSIVHKANRLKIHKSEKFWKEHPIIVKKKFTKNNNPMKNPIYKKKAIKSLKEGYKSGKIKISGVALKSSLGLTKGKNHPNWLGGKSFESYDIMFNNLFKKFILLRDGYCCMVCKEDYKKGVRKTFCVHHINYNKKDTTEENCIGLCNSCHAKTNFNRTYWIKFFQTLMSDRYGYEY